MHCATSELLINTGILVISIPFLKTTASWLLYNEQQFVRIGHFGFGIGFWLLTWSGYINDWYTILHIHNESLVRFQVAFSMPQRLCVPCAFSLRTECAHSVHKQYRVTITYTCPTRHAGHKQHTVHHIHETVPYCNDVAYHATHMHMHTYYRIQQLCGTTPDFATKFKIKDTN